MWRGGIFGVGSREGTAGRGGGLEGRRGALGRGRGDEQLGRGRLGPSQLTCGGFAFGEMLQLGVPDRMENLF